MVSDAAARGSRAQDTSLDASGVKRYDRIVEHTHTRGTYWTMRGMARSR